MWFQQLWRLCAGGDGAQRLPDGNTKPDSAKGATWLGASWIMLADVVGTSVLTMGYVVAQLGWVLTVGWIFVGCAIATYSALLMSRTYLLLLRHGIVVTSMGECARHAIGQKAALPVFGAVYGFAVMGNASYLLILGQAFRGMLGGLFDLDIGVAVGVVTVCCVPFVCSIRKVRETTGMAFGNSLVLYSVLAIIFGSLITRGRSPDTQTEFVASDLTILSCFGASTNILYGFASHWLYFEIMCEMESPSDFPKVFLVNVPVQVTLYLSTAVTAYYYLGGPASSLSAGGLLEDLPPGTWNATNAWLQLPNATAVAQGLLLVHVAIVFLVKTVVVTRFLVACVSPGSEDSASIHARIVHATCGMALMSLCAVISLALPYFNLFLGLIGGILAAPISFLLPVLLFIFAMGRFHDSSPELEEPLLVGSHEETCHNACDPFWERACLEYVCKCTDTAMSDSTTEPDDAQTSMTSDEETPAFRAASCDVCGNVSARDWNALASESSEQTRTCRTKETSEASIEEVIGKSFVPTFDLGLLRCQLSLGEVTLLCGVAGLAILCSCLGTCSQILDLIQAATDDH